jgi:dynactin complex subunit
VNAIADAEHREELHQVSLQRQIDAERQTALLVEMMAQNTSLTETIKTLTERVEALTIDVHRSVVELPGA